MTFLLSGLVWVPLIAAAGLMFFPARTEIERSRIHTYALAATGFVVALAVFMWYGFRDQTGTFAYEENRLWLPAFGSSYHLGADGVSMPLLLLSAGLFLVAVLASSRVREMPREYFVLVLLLETGVNGTFASLDYLLFFLFWQLQLVPMFLLIARWGGARRLRAAWKFLGFELAGSGALLLAILILYFKSPTHTFDIPTLHDVALPAAITPLLFWLFFAAFAIRLPASPFHTWFGDAQAEASAPIALLLAGAFIKLGGYGLIRVNVGEFQGLLHRVSGAVTVLAIVTVAWSLIAALAADDLRRLLGYVVAGHMGLVLLAVAAATPVALNGGILVMVADGLSTAMLILLAAAVSERVNSRSIREMGGLAARMPRGAILWLLGALAALGLPGLAGFVGGLMVLLGAYPAHRLAAPLVLVGSALLAGLMVWTLQRIFFGPLREEHARIRDLGTLELGTAVGLLSLIVLLGVLPAVLTDSINFSVLTLLSGSGG